MNEKFFVVLSQPQNATIADDTAIGTIRNDDTAVLLTESLVKENVRSTPIVTNIKVYPNPVKDVLYIQSKGIANFFLSDANGKTVITKQLNGNGSMDVSKLPAGTYFFRNDGSGEVQKVVVEK